MLQSVLNLVGLGQNVDFKKLKNEGAVILDVRSKGEYAQGHIKGSINIAVDQLANHLGKLDKSKVIITCCAAGGRSSMAKRILESHGYAEVHNGGGWTSLQSKI